MDMIERVAAALERVPVRDHMQEGGELDKLRLREAARAAIEAMREPTDGMVAAGNCRMYDEARAEDMAGENTEMTWVAMIDAALLRGEPKPDVS